MVLGYNLVRFAFLSLAHVFTAVENRSRRGMGSANRKNFSRNNGRENREEKKLISDATIGKLRLLSDIRAPKPQKCWKKTGTVQKKVAKIDLDNQSNNHKHTPTDPLVIIDTAPWY